MWGNHHGIRIDDQTLGSVSYTIDNDTSIISKNNTTRLQLQSSTLDANVESCLKSPSIYTVEKVVNDRVDKKGNRQFLVKWLNYSDKYQSWEPEENIFDRSVITEYFHARGKRR